MSQGVARISVLFIPTENSRSYRVKRRSNTKPAIAPDRAVPKACSCPLLSLLRGKLLTGTAPACPFGTDFHAHLGFFHTGRLNVPTNTHSPALGAHEVWGWFGGWELWAGVAVLIIGSHAQRDFAALIFVHPTFTPMDQAASEKLIQPLTPFFLRRKELP